jgi:hypothetical protein
MTKLAVRVPPFCASFEERGETGCWEWTLSRKGKRYAQVTGKKILLHRLMYEVHIGQIPEGMEIDHLCGNTWCCNPGHLEPVTHAENCRRGRANKLTEEEKMAIRLTTAPSHLIAEEFGVSAGHVRKIRGPLKERGIMRQGVR